MNNERTLKEYGAKSAKRLMEYLRFKGDNHKAYRYYSWFPRLLNNIVKDQAIYMSDGTGWNDRLDSEYFMSQSGEKKLFGLCFSYDIDESVAMWMLYGGLKDKGLMINFTYNQIHDLISECDRVELGEFKKEGKFSAEQTISSGEFKIYLQDVLYKKENEKAQTYKVLRDSEVIQSVDKKVLEGANPTLKTMPWSYEKEVRLIVEIDKSLIKVDHHFARIHISDSLLDKLKKRIVCSPKYDITADAHDMKNYNDSNNQIQPSTLHGQINWELDKKVDENN